MVLRDTGKLLRSLLWVGCAVRVRLAVLRLLRGQSFGHAFLMASQHLEQPAKGEFKGSITHLQVLHFFHESGHGIASECRRCAVCVLVNAQRGRFADG